MLSKHGSTEGRYGSLLTLSIFVCVLEGLNQAQSLVHRTTHRQVVNGDLPQDALVVNHKETPEIHKMLQFLQIL